MLIQLNQSSLQIIKEWYKISWAVKMENWKELSVEESDFISLEGWEVGTTVVS